MATIVKMPKLGTTMTEGAITKWLKKEGDHVRKGEIYAEIQTDKVNIEDEAPASGIVRKILVEEGETVPIGQPIVIIADENEDISGYFCEQKATLQKEDGKVEDILHQEELLSQGSKPAGKIKASPAAKRVAREHNVDLWEVAPTGPDGRIVEKDVILYIQGNKVTATPVARKIAEEKQIDLKTLQKTAGKRITKQDLFETQKPKTEEFTVKYSIPVTGMRKIIAEKMAYSKKIAPHIYLSLEVDMTKVIELKQKLSISIQEKYNVKLSYNDILIKAAAVALRQNPIINSSFSEEEIILKEEINIGLAVALDGGLIVPVIKNADRKGLANIASETSELIQKAKDKKLMPDDYHGGTFTISNLGMYDIEKFSAIINQPETAILAAGMILKKPVVTEDDEIAIRPMMNLTLSCDHRAIDGATGAEFLQNIKHILEEPVNMLL